MKDCRPLSPERLHLRRPHLVPRHGPDELRAMFAKVTKGPLSGKAGEPAQEDFKINGQYVDTPATRASSAFRSSTTTSRRRRLEFLDEAAKTPSKPFFMNVNFMKVHQPNLPHPDFIHKSMSKSKYADSVVENDTRIGRDHGQGPRARARQEHAGLLDHGQRRLAGRLSRRRLHPVPRHQGHRARGRQPRARDRLVARQDQGRRRRTTTSSAASTSWPRSRRSPA